MQCFKPDIDTTVNGVLLHSLENGFTVGPWAEHMWREGEHLLTRSDNPFGKDLMTKDGKDVLRSPTKEDVFHNSKLADVMKLLAEEVGRALVENNITHLTNTGGSGFSLSRFSLIPQGARRTFYDENSPVVKAIVDAVRNAGGVLSAAVCSQ